MRRRDHDINISTVIIAANDGYKRNNIPLPSPGVGGYCLSKDPQLLAYGAKQHTEAGDLFRAGRVVNDKMPEHVADIVDTMYRGSGSKEKPHIVIAGLAFKGSPATSDVRSSPSHDVIALLQSRGYESISGYDPHVSPDVFKEWKIGRIEVLHEVPENGDIIILMHRNPHYENIDLSLSWKGKQNKALIDPWGMYNYHREMIEGEGIAYANLGFNSNKKT